jgi:small multidrug resistance family-3 protein
MTTQLLLLARTIALFTATAIAEIVGCFLPYLWLKQGKSAWLVLPAAGSLATFAWLLTLHPSGAGRTYAAYGGVYVATAIVWLWLVERQRPDRWDLIGAATCLLGMAIIVLGPHR